MDIVYIRKLNVQTTIGVYDWEQDIKQLIVIDLDLGCDATKAGETDNLEHALDYKAISDRVIQFTGDSHYSLIEALAENLAKVILQEFNISWLRLQLSKPDALADATNVGITIERSL